MLKGRPDKKRFVGAFCFQTTLLSFLYLSGVMRFVMKRILQIISLPFTIDSMSPEEIISFLDSPTEEDKKKIKKAYEFALKAHEKQMRKSGDPYFVHVYETAKTLAILRMDTSTIVAGFLHDTLEDTKTTEEEIKKEFGDNILFLIKGVTKLGTLKYRGHERHVESLRKFLVATARDIRVLIIKLADRLHNMRTLEHLPKEKQMRIALETLEVYAPLAYRLSIRLLSRELEDLSFKYVYPAEFKKFSDILKQKEAETLPRLEKFIKSVKKELGTHDIVNFKIDYRQKGVYSTYKKWKNHEEDIEQIYDILAARIYVNTIEECYRVLGIIHANWRPLPGRIKDYIALPKPNGNNAIC